MLFRLSWFGSSFFTLFFKLDSFSIARSTPSRDFLTAFDLSTSAAWLRSESVFESEAMLISKRNPRLMICFMRLCYFPRIALAVAINSYPMIGSTCMWSFFWELLFDDCYADCFEEMTGSIWRADLELSLANWPTYCCYSVLKSSRVSMGAC